MIDKASSDKDLSLLQKFFLVFLSLFLVVLLFFFRSGFKSNSMLDQLAKNSLEPDIALSNGKPTVFEFYADWCEVCKEMAPKIDDIKNDYDKDINFVFLNVDNPKWEKYIRDLNVNGIPQVNIFDKDAQLEFTLIGKQEETIIKESLDNLKNNLRGDSQIINSEFSIIKDSKNYKSSPRSHE